jgi:hypothetical protein
LHFLPRPASDHDPPACVAGITVVYTTMPGLFFEIGSH